MSIIDRQRDITHLIALERGIGKIGIGRTFELVCATLGNSIHATTCKSTLTHIVRRDGDGHLLKGIEGDRHTATRQRTGLHTEGVVEGGTVDGNTRLTVVSTADGHTTGRTALRRHLHDIQHVTSHYRDSRHLHFIEVCHSTGTVTTHRIVCLGNDHHFLDKLRSLRQRDIYYCVLSEGKLDILDRARLIANVRHLEFIRSAHTHTSNGIDTLDIRHSTIDGTRAGILGSYGGPDNFLVIGLHKTSNT